MNAWNSTKTAPRIVAMLAISLVGCSRGTGSGDGSSVILRVSGVDVLRSELETDIAYFRTYIPSGADEREFTKSALSDDLIPNAAVRAAFRERITEYLGKAKAIRERLAAGEDFAEIAKVESQDVQSAKQGGDMGFVSRAELVQPLARVVYTMKDGEISEPLVSRFGVHIIRRTEFQKGSVPLDDHVRLSQILFAFGKGLQGRIAVEQVLAQAKVEVLDPALADLIPTRYRPK